MAKMRKIDQNGDVKQQNAENRETQRQNKERGINIEKMGDRQTKVQTKGTTNREKERDIEIVQIKWRKQRNATNRNKIQKIKKIYIYQRRQEIDTSGDEIQKMAKMGENRKWRK